MFTPLAGSYRDASVVVAASGKGGGVENDVEAFAVDEFAKRRLGRVIL